MTKIPQTKDFALLWRCPDIGVCGGDLASVKSEANSTH